MRLFLCLLIWVLATVAALANHARLPDNPYLSLEISFDGENIKSTDSPIEFTGTWSGRSLRLSGEGKILVDARGSNCSIVATIGGVGLEEKCFQWSSTNCSGTTQSFDLVLDIPEGYREQILLTASVGITAGSTEGGQIRILLSPSPAVSSTPVPSPTPQAEKAESPPWEVVIGTFLVVLAAALGMASVLKRGQKSHGYLLQVSTDQLRLAPGQTGVLEARAFRVDSTGSTTPAPEARLKVSAPSGLRVHPTEGTGQMNLQV